jgi:hypothetical protein
VKELFSTTNKRSHFFIYIHFLLVLIANGMGTLLRFCQHQKESSLAWRFKHIQRLNGAEINFSSSNHNVQRVSRDYSIHNDEGRTVEFYDYIYVIARLINFFGFGLCAVGSGDGGQSVSGPKNGCTKLAFFYDGRLTNDKKEPLELWQLLHFIKCIKSLNAHTW